MAEVFTPGFNKLLAKFRDQERIQVVERTREEPTPEFLLQRAIPRGYPLVFTDTSVTPMTEAQVVDFLLSRCPDWTVQVRRASFDSPDQYKTDRQLREITIREYLDELQSGGSYVGNQKLPDSIAAELAISPPLFESDAIEPPAFWLGGGV